MIEQKGHNFIDSIAEIAKRVHFNPEFVTTGMQVLSPQAANADRWIDYQIFAPSNNKNYLEQDPHFIGKICTAAKLQLNHHDGYFLVPEYYLELLFTAARVQEKQTKAELFDNSPILITRPTFAEILNVNRVNKDLISPMVNLTPMNSFFTVHTLLTQNQNITTIFEKTPHSVDTPSRFKASLAISDIDKQFDL